MDSSKNNHPSVDTLLAVMSEQLKTLLKSVDSIEKKLEAKVDQSSFNKLEEAFIIHRKEIEDKVNAHAVKIGVGAGIATGVSWLIHLMK